MFVTIEIDGAAWERLRVA